MNKILVEYFQSEVNGTCQCFPGYYSPGSSMPCAPCTGVIPQCSQCTGSSTCTACNTGFFLSGGTTCATCSSTLNYCIDCTSNGLSCLSCIATANMILLNGTCMCANGFYYLSGSCLPCTDPQCSSC